MSIRSKGSIMCITVYCHLSKGGGSGSRYWADLNSGSSYPQSSSNTERRTQGR